MNQKVVLVFVLLSVVMLACRCSVDGNGFSFSFSDPEPTVCSTCNSESTDPVLTEEAVTDHWVGDDFGPEQAFPAIVVGPAIAEIKGSAGYAALVKVNEGETLNWRGGGAWWQAFSQEALDARFPHHKAEYAEKWPKSSIFEHAYDVK